MTFRLSPEGERCSVKSAALQFTVAVLADFVIVIASVAFHELSPRGTESTDVPSSPAAPPATTLPPLFAAPPSPNEPPSAVLPPSELCPAVLGLPPDPPLPSASASARPQA